MSERPLDRGLSKIAKVVGDMADLAVDTVRASLSAYLEGGDIEIQVRAWSDSLRSMENDVEEMAVELIARHQPVATDLRAIKSNMKIAYDLSRFGRYAYDISHVLQLLDGYSVGDLDNRFVKEMGDRVMSMLHVAVEIYKTREFDKVDQLSETESEVDDMYRKRLRAIAQNPPEKAAVLISEVLLTRHLERIADHACYIVEEVHYMVRGRPMYIR